MARVSFGAYAARNIHGPFSPNGMTKKWEPVEDGLQVLDG
jgi:hypothetical protein